MKNSLSLFTVTPKVDGSNLQVACFLACCQHAMRTLPTTYIDQYYSSFLACRCNNLGTINNTIQCDQYTGACPCKPSIHGRYCDECKDGFYFFPITEATECLRCPCDLGGAYPRCNKVTGKDMSGPAAGCSLGIRDRIILHLLICRILWPT